MKRKYAYIMENTYSMGRSPSCSVLLRPKIHSTERRGVSCSSITTAEVAKLELPHAIPSGGSCTDTTRNPYKAGVSSIPHTLRYYLMPRLRNGSSFSAQSRITSRRSRGLERVLDLNEDHDRPSILERKKDSLLLS